MTCFYVVLPPNTVRKCRWPVYFLADQASTPTSAHPLDGNQRQQRPLEEVSIATLHTPVPSRTAEEGLVKGGRTLGHVGLQQVYPCANQITEHDSGRVDWQDCPGMKLHLNDF